MIPIGTSVAGHAGEDVKQPLRDLPDQETTWPPDTATRAVPGVAAGARLPLPEYLALCGRHFMRYWKQYTIPLVAVAVLQAFIRIDVNYTQSLPDHVFITVKGWKSGLKRGDYVAYGFPAANGDAVQFHRGDHMVKIIGGVAGDVVSMDEQRQFRIAEAGIDKQRLAALGASAVGIAKPVSRAGNRLEPGPVGVIPPGAYYVYAPHVDSLDSRYGAVGWITDREIIGRTFPIL